MLAQPINTTRQGKARAFTITELLVAVSLMSLIVVALYSMFNQIQRALRANESQVDSTERGRSVLELVSRELESAHAGLRTNAVNFWVHRPDQLHEQSDNTAPGTTVWGGPTRTNKFDDVFFQSKVGKAWRGV